MTRLFMEGVELDLIEEIDFELTYQIADIREVDRRNTSFSKTIVLPQTEKNQNAFGQIFDISVENEYFPNIKNVGINFNPAKIAKAKVYKDNVIIFDGVLRLIEIKITDGKIEYETNLFGRLKDILYSLRETYITDLQWDLYLVKHTLDFKQNFIQNKNLWNDGFGGLEINYPFVDYGKNPNWTTIDQKYLLPAVYIREIIEKIFDFAQFTFDCPFFNTTYFKRLLLISGEGEDRALISKFLTIGVFPWDNVTRITETPNNFQFSCGGGFALNWDPSLAFNWNIYTAVGSVEWINNFVSNPYPSVGTPTVTRRGDGIRFKFQEQINIRLRFDIDIQVGNILTNQFQIRVELRRYDNPSNPNSAAIPWQAQYVYSNPSPPWSIPSTTGADPVLNFKQDIPVSLNTVNPGNETWVFYITAGPFGTNCQSAPYSLSYTIRYIEFYNPTPIQVETGRREVNITNYLPRIKNKDFLKSIILMHNLYLEPHPTIENRLSITPYPLFYDDLKTKAVDWSSKLDRSQEVTITPISELTGFEYVFTFEDDNDYFTENYKKKFNSNYGSATIPIDNDFLPEQKRQKIFAAPPVMSQIDGKIMLHLYKVDSNNLKQAGKFKPRIAVFNRLNSGFNYTITDPGYFPPLPATPVYPYAGHLDDPSNPLYDICFGPPLEIYFEASNYTNNNLYTVYWEQLIQRISDYKSRLLTAYFYLTPMDILQLDFARLIVVGNHFYFLISVENYNPNGDGLTKVKLFKVREGLLPYELNFILQENDDFLLQQDGSSRFIQ